MPEGEQPEWVIKGLTEDTTSEANYFFALVPHFTTNVSPSLSLPLPLSPSLGMTLIFTYANKEQKGPDRHSQRP